ncbi:MAG: mechanosensitive ion channel [Candidatus Altiarchaeales archaeon]|nr:mechanosensitive ion channel [Candidatus Altiarchaeales archaeon]MBD3416973.1 mechanosensitive ion channel [Candidatus Altiarchaeales archaeon]
MIRFSDSEVREAIYLVGERIFLVLLIVVPARFLIAFVNAFLERLFERTQFDPTLEKFTHKSVVTVMWLATLAVVLVVLGVDVNAVVTSFGVGSFIVGFALKDTLNNFASGVLILVNKPFLVGDDIEVKGVRGTVKTITMSNTKLITGDRVKITLPNAFILDNPILNYTAYKEE